DRHAPGFVHAIHLEKAGVRRQRIKLMHGLATQVVAPDPAEDSGMISEAPCHHRKVRRSAAKARARWQHIPQKLADTEDQMRLSQSPAPVSAKAAASFVFPNKSSALPSQPAFLLPG